MLTEFCRVSYRNVGAKAHWNRGRARVVAALNIGAIQEKHMDVLG